MSGHPTRLHERERTMFRRISVATIVLTMLALAAPAGAGRNDVAGDIWVDMSESGVAAAAASSGDAWGTYGEPISFGHRLTGKISKQARIYVSVVCTQDDQVVYQWSANPDFDFPLVDQAGQGLEWDGGDADCTASLVYRVKKGKNVEITYLDTEAFHVYPSGS